jgi:hypothetical protein
MTTQLTAPSPSRTVRRRTLRAAAATAAALIATSAYVAAATIDPNPAPPAVETSPEVAPSARVMRELRESVAGQYGKRPAADAPARPSARVMRELRDSVTSQYGHAQ